MRHSASRITRIVAVASMRVSVRPSLHDRARSRIGAVRTPRVRATSRRELGRTRAAVSSGRDQLHGVGSRGRAGEKDQGGQVEDLRGHARVVVEAVHHAGVVEDVRDEVDREGRREQRHGQAQHAHAHEQPHEPGQDDEVQDGVGERERRRRVERVDAVEHRRDHERRRQRGGRHHDDRRVDPGLAVARGVHPADEQAQGPERRDVGREVEGVGHAGEGQVGDRVLLHVVGDVAEDEQDREGAEPPPDRSDGRRHPGRGEADHQDARDAAEARDGHPARRVDGEGQEEEARQQPDGHPGQPAAARACVDAGHATTPLQGRTPMRWASLSGTAYGRAGRIRSKSGATCPAASTSRPRRSVPARRWSRSAPWRRWPARWAGSACSARSSTAVATVTRCWPCWPTGTRCAATMRSD